MELNLFSRQGKEGKDNRPSFKHPWKIEQVENSLKCRCVRKMSGIPIDKVATQYFELDRINGTGAFNSPLKVMEMFDELKELTPRTIGYFYGDHWYLNFNKGILKRNKNTNQESFYSEETLRNKSLSVYLNLCRDPENVERDRSEPEVLSESTELETT